MVLLRILVFVLVEIPLALLVGFCRTVAERPIVQHAYYELFLPMLIDTVTHILSHPRVHQAAAPAVAEGVHAFCSQTERVEQHVRSLTVTVRKTQPAWARQQGKDFPLLLRSFFQGMVAAATVGEQREEQEQCCTTEQQGGERSRTSAKEALSTPSTSITRTHTAPTTTKTTAMLMLNVSAAAPSNNDDDDDGECKQADE